MQILESLNECMKYQLYDKWNPDKNINKWHGMWYSAFLEQNPLYLVWKYPEDYVRELEKTANKLRNKNKTNPFLA